MGQLPEEVMGLEGSIPLLGFLTGEETAIPWDQGSVLMGGSVPRQPGWMGAWGECLSHLDGALSLS